MLLGQGTDHDPFGCSDCLCSRFCNFYNDVCSGKESTIQTLLVCVFCIPYRAIAGICIGARFVPDAVAALAGGKHARDSIHYSIRGGLIRMFDNIWADDILFRK